MHLWEDLVSRFNPAHRDLWRQSSVPLYVMLFYKIAYEAMNSCCAHLQEQAYPRYRQFKVGDNLYCPNCGDCS